MELRNKQMIIEKLVNICKSANFEQTNKVLLPNPIVIGNNEQGSILCNGIEYNFNSYHDDKDNSIILNVQLNERPCDLYGNDFDYSYVKYNHNGSIEYGRRINGLISINEQILLDILNQLEELGMSWINYQTELQVKNRNYSRSIANNNGTVHQILSWDECLDMTETRMLIDKYSNGRKIQTESRDLKEMKVLGEEKYLKLVETRNELIMDILNDL